MIRSATLALLFVSAALTTPCRSQDTDPGKPKVVEAPPPIYDESADAGDDIAAAIARAKKENRRVLIQWGANWCGWCRQLDHLCKTNAEVKRKLLYEYDLVKVDVGRFNKNMDLVQRYGAGAEIQKGIPLLTIVDGDGKALAQVNTGPLESAGGGHDPAKVVEMLEAHQAPYLPAESILTEGLAKARTQDKVAFVHFGAPWCGWCHRLEDWMALEDVHAELSKHIVDIKIDIDRTIGGKDVLAKYQGDLPGGIPWFAFLKPDGTVIANCIVDGKNLGCPWSAEEKTKFAALLEGAAGLETAAVERILATLGAGAN